MASASKSLPIGHGAVRRASAVPGWPSVVAARAASAAAAAAAAARHASQIEHAACVHVGRAYGSLRHRAPVVRALAAWHEVSARDSMMAGRWHEAGVQWRSYTRNRQPTYSRGAAHRVGDACLSFAASGGMGRGRQRTQRIISIRRASDPPACKPHVSKGSMRNGKETTPVSESLSRFSFLCFFDLRVGRVFSLARARSLSLSLSYYLCR